MGIESHRKGFLGGLGGTEYLLSQGPPHFALPCSTDDKILSNCPPTPPLTKRQSTDNNLGLMFG